MSDALEAQECCVEEVELRKELVDVMLGYLNSDRKEYNNFMSSVESAMYESVMKKVRGNQVKGAKLLGVSRGCLRMKLMQHFNTTKVGGLYEPKPIARVDEINRRAIS